MADSPPRMADVQALIDRGFSAVEEGHLEQAEALLEEARSAVGDDHVRVLHLAGILAWEHGDLETATDHLMRATDQRPGHPEIYLDCADCLFTQDEIEEAEAQARAVLELDDVPGEQADQARLLLAQLRLADDDPDEAMEFLEQIDESRKLDPSYLSTHGTVLVADERYDEAVIELRRAIDIEPGNPDLHYQLGFALDRAGNLEASRAEMLRVLELDLEEWDELGDDRPPPPDEGESADLRERLEYVMEELPDPVLELVANVPIRVQTRATHEQVRAGLNPRSIIGLLGTPKREGEAAQLEALAIMRDILLSEVEDEDELDSELFYSLVEEIQIFFQRPDLVVADA